MTKFECVKKKMIVSLLSILFFIASILCYLFENNIRRRQICVPWKLINDFERFCYLDKVDDVSNEIRSIPVLINKLFDHQHSVLYIHNCCEISFEMIILTLLKDHGEEFGFNSQSAKH